MGRNRKKCKPKLQFFPSVGTAWKGGWFVCLSVQYMTEKWARLMLESAPYIGLAFLYLFSFFYEHYSQLVKNQNV